MDNNQLLTDIHGSLGEIKANLKTYHEEVKDMQTRLRSVELWKARVMGSLAVLAFPVTILVAAFKRNHSA